MTQYCRENLTDTYVPPSEHLAANGFLFREKPECHVAQYILTTIDALVLLGGSIWQQTEQISCLAHIIQVSSDKLRIFRTSPVPRLHILVVHSLHKLVMPGFARISCSEICTKWQADEQRINLHFIGTSRFLLLLFLVHTLYFTKLACCRDPANHVHLSTVFVITAHLRHLIGLTVQIEVILSGQGVARLTQTIDRSCP